MANFSCPPEVVSFAIIGVPLIIGMLYFVLYPLRVLGWRIARIPFNVGAHGWITKQPSKIRPDERPDFPKEALSGAGLAVAWEAPNGYAFTMADGTKGGVEHARIYSEQKRRGKGHRFAVYGWRFIFVLPNMSGRTGIIHYNTQCFGSAKKTTRQLLEYSSGVKEEVEGLADVVDAFVKKGLLGGGYGDPANGVGGPLLLSFEKNRIVLWVTLRDKETEGARPAPTNVHEVAHKFADVVDFTGTLSKIIR